MAIFSKLAKNATKNLDSFNAFLDFAKKNLSDDAFATMQKEFRESENFIFNTKIIKSHLKKNDILSTEDMVKFIRKNDSDGMFSEALKNRTNVKKPRGPRPEKQRINKKGELEDYDKFQRRQDKWDAENDAYEKWLIEDDAYVTDIYNQLKNHNDEYIKVNENGELELRTDKERKEYRQEQIRRRNIETKQQEASRKEQQQQIEYANKGLLGKLWTNLTGHAQVKYNDDGSIANALWARNTINSAYSPVERAVKSGKINIVQGDEAKYTKQGFISNFGNRFDVYGDVYGQAGISQSFFQSLGYDGIGDFAKNNQLIVAGAIAGAGIGTAGIASAVSNSKKNRGY